jgi:DNA-binding NarL/FixJ family response regulator
VSEVYRILIGERRGLVREALRALLDGHPEIEVVGESEDGVEIARLASDLTPDVVLVGLSVLSQDGIRVTEDIKRQTPSVRVVILTEDTSAASVRSAFAVGADGYLVKSASFGELGAALARVRGGGRYLGPEATELVLAEFLRPSESNLHQGTELGNMTSRELEILRLFAEGKTSREAATALGISPRTADKHKANIMKKLDIHNTAALTAFAIRELSLVP